MIRLKSIWNNGSFRQYAVLTLCVFLSFWPVMFDTSILGDGILNYDLLTSDKPDSIIDYYIAFGLPLHGWFAYLTGFLEPMVLAHKILAFLCIMTGGWYMLATITRLNFLPKSLNLPVVLLAVCFPIYTMWIDMAKLSYAFSHVCFYAGAFYYLKWMSSNSKWIMLLLSLMLFSMAFQVSSFLLYFYGFIGGVGLLHINSVESPKTNATHFIKKHGLILAFPVVYFFGIMKVFFKPIYPYNEFNYSIKALLQDSIVSLYGLFIEPLNRFWHFVENNPMTCIFIAAYALSGVFLLSRAIPKAGAKTSMSKIKAKKLLIFGSILLFLAVFPYVLVGKPVRGFGYASKNALLSGLPVSLMVISCLIWLFSNHVKRIFNAVTMIVVLFIAMNLSTHITWQNRYIKYLSLIENLQQIPPPEERVIFFRDNFPQGSRMLFRHIELHKALGLGWQDTNRYAHELNTYVEWDYRLLYTDPMQISRVWKIPWNMDHEMLQWIHLTDEESRLIMASTPQQYLSRTQRIFNDIGHNNPPEKSFDGTGLTKAGLLAFSGNDQMEEGVLCWKYLWSSRSEKKLLLQSIARLDYSVVDWSGKSTEIND
ncbi:MAG: hypothetical protein HEP71_11375 [Roseivirga sp.]|nr:hypothetical protein [Roseivirga sp.]